MAHLMKSLGSILLAFVLLFQPVAFANEGEPLNINTATAEQLAEGLVGIGPKKAQAIIEYREANGGFVSIDELLEIKGIGSAILEKNRALIRLQ